MQTRSSTYSPTYTHPLHMPFLRTNDSWQILLQSFKPSSSHYGLAQICHISFAIKRSAKLVHQSRCQYNITKLMHQEIEFFHEKLLPNSGIYWESPIAHIIPRMPIFITFGDRTVASKGPEDTLFPLAFGGTCHFLKRSSSVRSYTNGITQTVNSFQSMSSSL